MEPGGNVARAAGLQLIDRSAGLYEDARVDLDDRDRWVPMLFGARARSLTAGTFALADAGHPQEAAAILRSIVEYLITLHWLLLDFEAHDLVWQIDDLRSTLVLVEDAARSGLPIMADADKAVFETEKQRLRGQLEDLENIDARVPAGSRQNEKLPGFEQRAQATGLGDLYALAYRWDSLAAAHPNETALTQLLERQGREGVIRTTPIQTLPDAYSVGASLLLFVLQKVGETHADLVVPDIDEIARQIPALAGP